MRPNNYIIICFALFSAVVRAQEIPLGTWRMHVAYNAVVRVALDGNYVFAAVSNGVMRLDRQEGSIETYTKLNGLTGTGITDIAFHPASGQLIVTYADGNFDLVGSGTVLDFNPVAHTPVDGSKKINDVTVSDGLAYLSTDYGIVVFDLARKEIKETWRDLGPGGETLKVFQAIFSGDSIFLATENGVLAGDRDDNLLDFSAWRRLNAGALDNSVSGIILFDGKIYAAINGVGIHRYEHGNWSEESFLQDMDFSSLGASSEYLYIATAQNLWRVDKSGVVTGITDEKIVHPMAIAVDDNESLWIGDGREGLVSNAGGTFRNYLPNGPSIMPGFRLKYAAGKMYLLGGGYSSAFQPTGNNDRLNYFESGTWHQVETNLADLTDYAVTNTGNHYLSSFGHGVRETTVAGNVTLYNENNSTLLNLNPPGNFVNVSALEASRDGVWVTNYGAAKPLHLFRNDQTWQEFSFSVTAARYPLDLAVDLFGNPWMVLNPALGGGIMVLDKENGGQVYVTDANGGGALPSRAVRSIAVDRDGYVWVGTDVGVAYFFSASEDAVKPVFDRRHLLQNDKVTAIAVDGGNRKWMGTERGVWLFDPLGESLVHNFTTANSPLPSNEITDIEINDETGEVFFLTRNGLISFRSDATRGTPLFQNIKIYPNPVTSNFTGTVGITGLSTDAIVKITDISGKLIWQTQAHGGTASWNVSDYNGRRASTGVYVVFCASPDGVESEVGKIAVID
ncbi:MAG TPA: two-component regulator propeller domain-containing protein [Ohtaekwangia sp.]|nr:two-component regulator propeller domain-containing protein [Ohtaekwangia sp.]